MTTESSDHLTTDFDRDGFVLIESLLGSGDVADLASGVEWALATQGGHRWIKQRSYDWHETHPIFVKLIEHPVVLALATDWLGGDFHLIAAQCSRNTRDDPYAPGAMEWHQDSVFFPDPARRTPGIDDDRYSLSAMWFVHDTPIEMGPTQLLTGSQHNTSILPDNEISQALFSRSIPAGSLLLFNNRTWHRGRLNTTAIPRDLVTNAYARPEVDKVQLTTLMPDGVERYVEPTDLLTAGSRLASLLRRRD